MDQAFLKQMQDMLKDEYPQYLESLNQKENRGFRVNTLKINEKDFFSLFSCAYHKSPFAKNGYYLDEDISIGKTPLYAAGLLYMQEPSASSAVTVLDVKPGMKVLDLCAAPGSKSTQILEMLNGEGLLVANEYVRDRASILKENIERAGAYNAIITNADTKDIADTFEDYFDAVLCDAPCSGEGMFRKEEKAIENWSLKNVEQCALRQEYILENAYRCLNKGGVLVYSTCTFNLSENENQIVNFINKHDDMEIINAGVSFGRKGFPSAVDTEKAVRIFPMDEGEGHFICKMKKMGEPISKNLKELKSDPVPSSAKQFFRQMLENEYPYLFCYKNKVYGGVVPFYSTGKANLIRHQVYLGEDVHGRFEPSHALFMSSYTKFKKVIDLSDDEVMLFLKGQTISKKCEKGYYAVNYRNYVIGFIKSDGNILKNKYPKAYRLKG